MAAAKRAFATKLYRETTEGSGGAGTTGWTQVGGMTQINWPEMQTEMQDSTDMDAPSATRTREPTLNNVGDTDFALHYDSSDASQLALEDDWAAQTRRKYKIIGTDGGAAAHAFYAWITRFRIVSEVSGLISANVTLSPTGPLTRT
jgi:hypothetical protein